MSHQVPLFGAKGGDYVNVPQDNPPEVVRNNTSNLEVVPNRAPLPSYSEEKSSYLHHERPPDQVRVLGVKPRIFWLMIVLIVLILAIGIGAGVGAGLSSRRHGKSPSRSSTSTAVPLPTTAFPTTDPKNKPAPTPLPNSIPSAAGVSCPVNDTLDYTPAYATSESANAYAVNSSTLTYTIHCGYTYDSSADIDDIQWISHTNLTTCIDLCSIFNVQYPYGGGQYGFYGLCSGVTVSSNGTCQLKTGVEVGAKNADKKGDGDSAMLVW